MKYTVKIADKTYEVEIEDIYARPVIARVDGQEFEVSPLPSALHSSLRSASQSPTGRGDEGEGGRKQAREFPSAESSKQLSISSSYINELTSPLPGTVIEIFVKVGEQIEAGQVLLVIEAMKMKNSIRSTRAGKIAEVLVSAGQTVAHKQVLVRFG